MKTLVLVLFLAVTCIASQAQVVPTTPTKFGKRNLGAGNTSSGTISAAGNGNATTGATIRKPETVVRTVTYISLSPARQWTSSEGKPLLAKLIAFEDVTTEEVKTGTAPALQAPPAQAPSMPKLPGKPTVVKDGKVRLLVGQQAFELALDKLSALDRDFIGSIKHRIEESTAK